MSEAFKIEWYKGFVPQSGEQVNQFNECMTRSWAEVLWTQAQLVEALGVSLQRVFQLSREGIPGKITLGSSVFYIREYAEPWAAEYVAKRKGKAGALNSERDGVALKPKVAKVKIPGYLKVVKELTPALIVSDHNIPLESCCPLHHHWSEWEGLPSKRGNHSKEKALRHFRYVDPITGQQTPELVIPKRYVNNIAMGKALADYYLARPELVSIQASHGYQKGLLIWPGHPEAQVEGGSNPSPEQQARNTIRANAVAYNKSIQAWHKHCLAIRTGVTD